MALKYLVSKLTTPGTAGFPAAAGATETRTWPDAPAEGTGRVAAAVRAHLKGEGRPTCNKNHDHREGGDQCPAAPPRTWRLGLLVQVGLWRLLVLPFGHGGRRGASAGPDRRLIMSALRRLRRGGWLHVGVLVWRSSARMRRLAVPPRLIAFPDRPLLGRAGPLAFPRG